MPQEVLRPEHLRPRRGDAPEPASTNRLLAALAYLTLLPIPAAWIGQGQTGRAVAFFPVIGASLGALGVVIYTAVAPLAGALVAASATSAVWTLASGILTDDSRALLATKRRALVTLLAVGFLRWQLLYTLTDGAIGLSGGVALAIIAAQAIPRAGIAAMAWTARPAGSGMAFELSQRLGSGSAISAIVQGLLIAFAAGGVQLMLLVLLLGYLVVRLLATWFYSSRGGITGSALGFAELLLEAGTLALLASPLFVYS